MNTKLAVRAPAPICAFALLLAACGSTDDAGQSVRTEDTATRGPTPTGTRPVEIPDPTTLSYLSNIWRTDFSKLSVNLDEFTGGGVGKDAIPAIDEPVFVSVADADFLSDREPVLALEINGDARAYPVQILMWHEIVNDTVGGDPVVVTYCPLCNSAITFSRTIDGKTYDFGVSGLLRNSDLVMYDRQSETWWQQITGEAVVGALTGLQLEFVPSSMVSFADFRDAHPEGQVLSRETGFDRSYGRNPYVGYDEIGNEPFLFDGQADSRLDAVDRVVAFEIGGEPVAYPFSRLTEHPVVNDVVGGEAIAVFFRKGTVSPLDRSAIADSEDVGSGLAFSRDLDGRTLTFEASGDAFVDTETRSTWSITGKASEGPLAGQQLTPVIHGNHFWFSWAAFQPETRVWQPEGGG